MGKNIFLALDAWYPQVSGPNVVVTNYFKEFEKTGNVCKLVVPSYGKKQDQKADRLTGLNPVHCKGVYIPFGGFYNVLPDSDKNVKKLFAECPPDILHCHSPFNLGKYFAKYGKKHGVPTIYTFHTKFKDEFLRITKSKAITNFLMKRIMKVINAQDYVWTVSNGSAETLREYGYKGEITVIRNGTDMTLPSNPEELVEQINDEYGLSGQENVLLFVGRIVRVKNLQLIFSALKKVKEQSDIPFKMIVVGTGSELAEYKKMVEDFGIADRVLFVGEITDRNKLKGFYLRADLFAFASTFDTASLCPLEAATFSLPTLLIKDSPTSETVQDNFSGFCEAQDADGWAKRIVEIFSDKAKLKEVGENARKHVYRSWEDVAREVEGHYEEILSKNG